MAAAAAAAATGVDLVDGLDDYDFDVDVIQALESDLSTAHDDGFRGGSDCYYSSIFSDADVVATHCRHGCEDGDGDGDGGAAAACGWHLAGLDDDDDDWAEEEEEEEAAGSSPADSGVTDNGPLTPTVGDDADAVAMAAYVAELERFLLEDDDDAPCGEQAEVDQGLLGGVDGYFAGDQLLATADEVVPGAGRAEPTDGDGEDQEENGDDVLAAREDDQSSTSRKRASIIRNKIKGTAMLTPWGELAVMNLMMMHLAQIQVPAAAAAAPSARAPLCGM